MDLFELRSRADAAMERNREREKIPAHDAAGLEAANISHLLAFMDVLELSKHIADPATRRRFRICATVLPRDEHYSNRLVQFVGEGIEPTELVTFETILNGNSDFLQFILEG